MFRKKVLILFLCILMSIPLIGCAPKEQVPQAPGSRQESVPPPGENLPSDIPAPPPQNPKPEPPAHLDTLVVSVTDGLTVRSGPGTSFGALGSLDKGDMAAYVDLKNGWYGIYFLNTVAYVSAAYSKTTTFPSAGGAAEKVIDCGEKLLGIPYLLGAQRYHWGDGVRNADFTGQSFDCSTLMQYIFKIGANVILAATSRGQSLQGTAVAPEDIRRGDLLFFTNDVRVDKTGLERIGHVALYLGNGYLLHTASDHAVIEPVGVKRRNYFITAKRFLQPFDI